MTDIERSGRLLRLACGLVAFTLLALLGSLFWSHPTSFVVFALIGGPCFAGGLGVYLYWLLVTRPETTPTGRP